MNTNQIIDAMKANLEFSSQKYQVAYVEHAGDFSAMTINYRRDSLSVKIDETYAVSVSKAWALISLWAKHHNAKLIYDEESPPYLFKVA
jgi:hypothetical protein